MNISSAQLSEVFARYNEAARTGTDPDFGRTRFLQELKEPPFYFGRERFEVHYTCGGIAINPKAEVLYAGSQNGPSLGSMQRVKSPAACMGNSVWAAADCLMHLFSVVLLDGTRRKRVLSTQCGRVRRSFF